MSTLYTKEQLDFIASHRKQMTVKQITDLFNSRFGTHKNSHAINAICTRYGFKCATNGQYQKGGSPWNAGTLGQGLTHANTGSYKKGNTPHNTRALGSERINSNDGYRYVKIAEPNTWRQKHLLIWEAEHGPIPSGHIVRFIDGDITNINLNNLELATRNELLQYNINGLKKAHPDLQPVIKMVSKIQAKLYEQSASTSHG